MAQRYTHPVALLRMSRGLCPECGLGVDEHTGWGNAVCSLTDNGVADRIHQHQQDVEQKEQT